LGLVLAAGLPVAWADCTDNAAPKVNWHRCLQDDRDLSKVNLSGAELREATFLRSDLTGANLANADAYRAKFFSATMVGAVLDGTRLLDADFTRANLTGASLKGADLRGAKFDNADLTRANLTGARLERSDLRDTVLGGATWVDGIRVCAPASVGQCN
jgi:uncharacterized protein YjbI with pentapeptide repeats